MQFNKLSNLFEIAFWLETATFASFKLNHTFDTECVVTVTTLLFLNFLHSRHKIFQFSVV